MNNCNYDYMSAQSYVPLSFVTGSSGLAIFQILYGCSLKQISGLWITYLLSTLFAIITWECAILVLRRQLTMLRDFNQTNSIRTAISSAITTKTAITTNSHTPKQTIHGPHGTHQQNNVIDVNIINNDTIANTANPEAINCTAITLMSS
jgi:hypothetical protein